MKGSMISRATAVGLTIAVVAGAAHAEATAERIAVLYDGGAAGSFSGWLGAGVLGGDVTYEIGGTVLEQGELIDVPDPLSALTWPLGVALIEAGGQWRSRGGWELLGRGSMAVGDPSDPVTDTDWFETGVPYVYSESDATLDAYALEVGGRYWLLMGARPAELYRTGFAVGGGVLYQSMEWTASNLRQWYPVAPGSGVDRVEGVVGTYAESLLMPYVEFTSALQSESLEILASVGLAPYLKVQDEDDHLLRELFSETDADGYGVSARLAATWWVGPQWGLSGRVGVLSYFAEGRAETGYYGGPQEGRSWTIDHHVESTQWDAVLSVVARY